MSAGSMAPGADHLPFLPQLRESDSVGKQEGAWQKLKCSLLIFSASNLERCAKFAPSTCLITKTFRPAGLQACLAPSTAQQLLVPPPPVHPLLVVTLPLCPTPGDGRH